MCGIAGAFAFGLAAKQIDQTIVERLNYQQRRRGPDGAGLWSSEDRRIVIGHRRLATIDTSPMGAQPMSDASGRWVISFNGEVYNYRALRGELERLGCVFRTNSDTEVLINVVDRWGEAGLRKLRGMYAVALWDCVERELWLVRDPCGIKPLYLAETAGTLWFASQARALARCAPINTGREAAALTGFYLWGHIPEPFTWWAGIRMLPAGHVLRVRAGAECHAKPFAKIEDAYVRRPALPLHPDELRSLLRDSVSHHLVSDVPVGVFLSAGVDSNVVAALASEFRPKLQAVTLAFDEYAGTKNDEAPLAEAAAQAIGCEHTVCRIGRSEFGAVIDDFFDCMDQPTIDGLNTYLVSYVAKKLGLKVALSGLGGDELFGGYPSFRDVPRLARWARLSKLQPIGKAIQRALRAIALPGMPPKLPGLFTHSTSLATAYLLRRSLYLEDELDTLLDESWISEGLERLATQSALEATVAPLHAAAATEHAQIAALESCWYMRNQLLRDTDWSSMANGVEVRVPLVDFALIERLGPAIASQSPPTKRDLVACSDRIPAAISERSKTGFTTPVRQWIADRESDRARGLRGWAGRVHQRFRGDQSHLILKSRFETLPEINRLMRVQMLLTDGFGGFGGISRFNRDFLSALNVCPLVERVFALPRVISDPIEEPIPEAVVYERRAARGRVPYTFAVIRHALRGPRADLVICGHINLLPLAWAAARLARARLALVIHGYEAWASSSHRLSNLLVNRIDAFVAVSGYSAERFVQWSGVPAARGFILPNCVDLDRFQPRERDLVLGSRYGLRSAIVMLTVGRLATSERYKGVDEVIDVMPRLLRQLPDLRYLIVGDGSDRARLEAKARAHGLSDYVIFAGRIAEPEKVAHYNLADVYVMPSHGEGFGIALIEAAACGIPVVGSSVDGSREALLDGQLGRMVDPSNPDELVLAIGAAINARQHRVRNQLVETFSIGRFRTCVAEWVTQQAELAAA